MHPNHKESKWGTYGEQVDAERVETADDLSQVAGAVLREVGVVVRQLHNPRPLLSGRCPQDPAPRH